ncbi:MAG: hypothetical protein ABFR65_07750 [Pseudomonadota bacterium]
MRDRADKSQITGGKLKTLFRLTSPIKPVTHNRKAHSRQVAESMSTAVVSDLMET